MADITLKEGVRDVTIDKNASLSTGSRAAGDYDNSTNLHPLCDVTLVTQYDTTAPTEGDVVGDLYVLYGDGEASEGFPPGGDGTVGNNDDPAEEHWVGAFVTREPSITTDERMVLKDIRLSHANNRFVFRNDSGQTMDSTWQLEIKTKLLQV